MIYDVMPLFVLSMMLIRDVVCIAATCIYSSISSEIFTIFMISGSLVIPKSEHKILGTQIIGTVFSDKFQVANLEIRLS